MDRSHLSLMGSPETSKRAILARLLRRGRESAVIDRAFCRVVLQIPSAGAWNELFEGGSHEQPHAGRTDPF